jgi:hypothetical protein
MIVSFLRAGLSPSRPAAVALAAAVMGTVLCPATAQPSRAQSEVAQSEGGVSAASLLSKTATCHPASKGRYGSGNHTSDAPVCGARGAVFWKAHMYIDCDGRPGRHCNARTDPDFLPATAFQQADGQHLSAEQLPYVIVPAPSRTWDYRNHGVKGGSVAAVIHNGHVLYAVVGDVGPRDLIGEASYAAAKALGINPDPRSGGTSAQVTYIVFKNSKVTPIESHQAAVALGERLATGFVRNN